MLEFHIIIIVFNQLHRFHKSRVAYIKYIQNMKTIICRMYRSTVRIFTKMACHIASYILFVISSENGLHEYVGMRIVSNMIKLGHKYLTIPM